MGRRSRRESAKAGDSETPEKTGKPQRPEKPPVRTVHLFDGETIVLIARPARTVTGHKYLVTLGLYSIWRKRTTFVLTDRRILIGMGCNNPGRAPKRIAAAADTIGAAYDVPVGPHGRGSAPPVE